MKFSVCLDMMFQYTDFYDRFAECKKKRNRDSRVLEVEQQGSFACGNAVA